MMQEGNYRLISAYDRSTVFEGSYAECIEWLLDQAEHLTEKRCIYRVWSEDDEIRFDVGYVYIIKDVFDYEW